MTHKVQFDRLDDVNMAGKADGDVPTWDTGTSKYVPAAPAAALEVKEADGSPDVTGVTQIIVTDGTLTDNGGGSVSIDIGTGGSGASTADHFIVGQGGEGDSDLSNKVIIPGLSASPDIRVAGANDWEFDSSTTTGWSSFAGGGATTFDFDTTVKSHAYVKCATNGSADKFGGIIHAAPSVGYTMTAKMTDRTPGTLGNWPGIFVSDSATAAGQSVMIGSYESGGAGSLGYVRGYSFSNLQAPGFTTDSGNKFWCTAPLYLRIKVTAANNIDVLASYNGLIWFTVHAGYSNMSTAAYFGICIDSFSTAVEAVFDWIRFT